MQYEWPLQSHTLNFVKSLAGHGHTVDLFICRCSTELVNIQELLIVRNVRVIRIGDSLDSSQGLSCRVRSLFRELMKFSVGRLFFSTLLLPLLPVTLRYSRETRYDFSIGVEKSGLIWASLLYRMTGVPFFYFSLELYDEQHPYFRGWPGFSAWRRDEITAHKLAKATIIQDRHRGEHLDRSNSTENTPKIYFPISTTGAPIVQKRDYLRKQYGISNDKRILLYLGLIDESRGCLDVARTFGSTSEIFALVFHGYGDKRFVEKIRGVSGGSLNVSLDLVPEEELPYLVSSADIGLALYRRDCANDLLTACSSEKVALYCRAGIPFIAFTSDSYLDLKAKFDCCELIDHVEELESAAENIIKKYEYYRENAYRAFISVYQYEYNVVKVIESMNNIIYFGTGLLSG